jgi:hypothetical protein
VDTVLTAGVVLTVDAHDGPRRRRRGDRPGVVVDVGPVAEVLARVVPRERVDLPRHLLMPGLVNAHTHLSMAMFRGFTDDLDLADFLGRIVPAEATMLDAATVGTGTRAAATESVCGGVTSALDMYFFPDAGLAAGAEVGLRVLSGPVVLDDEGIHSLGPDALVDDPESWLAEHPPVAGWRPVVSPHSVYTVARERLVHAGELAAAHDAVLHLHAAETMAEVQGCMDSYGRRPVELLDELGLLGPRTVLAHGVHLTDAEIDRLAATGTSVALPGVQPEAGLGGGPCARPARRRGERRARHRRRGHLERPGHVHGAAPDRAAAQGRRRRPDRGAGPPCPAHGHLGWRGGGRGGRAAGHHPAGRAGRPDRDDWTSRTCSRCSILRRRSSMQPDGDVPVWVGGAPVVRDRRPMRVDPSGVTAELAALRARVLATLD